MQAMRDPQPGSHSPDPAHPQGPQGDAQVCVVQLGKNLSRFRPTFNTGGDCSPEGKLHFLDDTMCFLPPLGGENPFWGRSQEFCRVMALSAVPFVLFFS